MSRGCIVQLVELKGGSDGSDWRAGYLSHQDKGIASGDLYLY
jgi:hypothetical protein